MQRADTAHSLTQPGAKKMKCKERSIVTSSLSPAVPKRQVSSISFMVGRWMLSLLPASHPWPIFLFFFLSWGAWTGIHVKINSRFWDRGLPQPPSTEYWANKRKGQHFNPAPQVPGTDLRRAVIQIDFPPCIHPTNHPQAPFPRFKETISSLCLFFLTFFPTHLQLCWSPPHHLQVCNVKV